MIGLVDKKNKKHLIIQIAMDEKKGSITFCMGNL